VTVNIHVISQVYLPESAGVFAADLVERWSGRGHRVTVFTATPSSTSSAAEIVHFAGGTAYDRRSLGARLASQMRFFVRMALAAKQYRAPAVEAVVIVGSPVLVGLLPLVTDAYRKSKIVHWAYDLYPEALNAIWGNTPFVRALSLPMARTIDLGWSKANHVVAISSDMADRIRRRVPRVPVTTIPLWARSDIVPRSDRSPQLRRERGIPDEAFVVMYHGNFGLAYDFEPILGAARLLVGERQVVFALVGAGTQLESLRARVSRDGLSNLFIFPPVSVRGLPDSIAMGDCHLMAVRDGFSGVAFPSKFITAIAAARPVIVLGSKETELAKLVLASVCGAVVRAEPRTLANAIDLLSRDPQCARQHGEAGRGLYERQFERENALTLWDALIEA
jgi:colanic acid biosynthesis glycosyl transferase WcaI